MDYVVTAQPVLPRVGKKRLERFSLLLYQCWRFRAELERLSPVIADHRAYSAIFRVGQKANRPWTIRSVIPFSRRSNARDGHQLPRAD